MQFDSEIFFAAMHSEFGPLQQSQVDGLNELRAAIAMDSFITDVRYAAYMLATCYHETAQTCKPIDERGGTQYFNSRYGPTTSVGKQLGNKQPGDGARFHGRGYVQLTGRANYAKMTAELLEVYVDEVADFEQRSGQAFDLVGNPDQAKDAEIAYLVMSYGMRMGAFTGHKLANYIGDGFCSYLEARKIINGLDQAVRIEGYAERFERVLRAALVEKSNASE